MLKGKQYLVLGFAAVLAIVLMSLPGRTTQRLKLAVGSIFLPLFGLAGATQDTAGKAANVLTSRNELERANEVLRRENMELRINLEQADAIRTENDRLRKSLETKIRTQDQKKWKLKFATVVLREPSNWWRNVQIDAGTRDGVTNNLAVLTADGFLAGRVMSAGLTHSQVVLLGDPTCKVSARIENEMRDAGVIGGAGPLENEFVEMSYLARNAIIKPGQLVRTTGDGGLFPKDIPIGRVVDFRAVEYGLLTSARVRLGANLSALEEVWVLMK
jgi:rod shape-determining protein MreC